MFMRVSTAVHSPEGEPTIQMTLNATLDSSECTEGVYAAYQEDPNVRE